jgi:hypothetical protein
MLDGKVMNGVVVYKGELPFSDVISGEMNAICVSSSLSQKCEEGKFYLQPVFIRTVKAGIRTCVRKDESQSTGGNSGVLRACTFYSVPRVYRGFAQPDLSGSLAKRKIVKLRKTNFEYGTWFCARTYG